MNQNIKNLIRRNKLFYALLFPVISIRRRIIEKITSKKQKRYDVIFSNVVGGNIKVFLRSIPGTFEIDVRSHILRKILMTKDYEPEIVNHIFKYFDKDKDAVNVGANIGLFTNLLASNINNKCKVLAIEPTPNAFKLLESNVEINGNREKTILYNGIATEKPGNYKINVIQGNEEYSSIGKIVHPVIKNRKIIETKVVGETIDNLVKINNLRPGIIIIDVEGAEYSVLKGSINTINNFKPIIISEIVDEFLSNQGSDSKQIINLLEGLGYRITDLEDNEITYPFLGSLIAIPLT